MEIKPNPDFIKDIPEKERKKWAKALIAADKRGIKQAQRRMIWSNGDIVAMCCLMVGHVAYKGTDSQRDGIAPKSTSPFAKVFKEVDPFIGMVYKTPTRASELNDLWNINFPKLAKLLMNEKIQDHDNNRV